VLPLDAEMRPAPGFRLDAVGDGAASAGDGMIRKYNGRALLVATCTCSINYRYCFRRHFHYAVQTASASGRSAALARIARDESIEEVIPSGGDPLSLTDAKLSALFDGLRAMPHVRRL